MSISPQATISVGLCVFALAFTGCDEISSGADRVQEGLSELIDNLRSDNGDDKDGTQGGGDGRKGSVVNVTSPEALEAELSDPNRIVMVNFTAEWCGACKHFEPTLDAIVNRDSRITLVKVDVDASPELARSHKVRSIPDTRLMLGGREQERIIGALSFDDAWEKFPPLLKIIAEAREDDAETAGEDGQPKPSIEPTPQDWLPEGITPATGS